jgi:O-antigen ligase
MMEERGPLREASYSRWVQFLVTASMLLAIALPLAPSMVPLCVALVALATIGVRIQHGGGHWRLPSLTGALLWMALYYLLHVVGMGWTANTAFGWFDLEVKAGLLLFPVLLWVLPANTEVDVPRIWRWFVWANAVSVIISLGASIGRFTHELQLRTQGLLPEDPAWTNHFFESRFSFVLHPSYMAMYLCVALGLVLLKRTGTGPRSFIERGIPALLVLGIILCNSKIGWVSLAVVMTMAAIVGWADPEQRRRSLRLAAGGAILFTAFFAAFPTVSGKLTQAIQAAEHLDPGSDQSSALRRMAWRSAVELFKKEPLVGVGTGDIKDELIAQYHVNGYVHAEAKRMNAHGQFLQSMAALGLPGLLLLLGAVLVPLVKSFIHHDKVSQMFWSITFLNLSVESMAEVQAGVVFISYFCWLLTILRTAEPLSRTSGPTQTPIHP